MGILCMVRLWKHNIDIRINYPASTVARLSKAEFENPNPLFESSCSQLLKKILWKFYNCFQNCSAPESWKIQTVGLGLQNFSFTEP